MKKSHSDVRLPVATYLAVALLRFCSPSGTGRDSEARVLRRLKIPKVGCGRLKSPAAARAGRQGSRLFSLFVYTVSP